jgi:hypothetical protein
MNNSLKPVSENKYGKGFFYMVFFSYVFYVLLKWVYFFKKSGVFFYFLFLLWIRFLKTSLVKVFIIYFYFYIWLCFPKLVSKTLFWSSPKMGLFLFKKGLFLWIILWNQSLKKSLLKYFFYSIFYFCECKNRQYFLYELKKALDFSLSYFFKTN